MYLLVEKNDEDWWVFYCMKNKIKDFTEILLGIIFLTQIREKDRQIKHWRQSADKSAQIMKLYDQWIFIHQDHKSIYDYFAEKGIKSIAIYGMDNVGERFYEELKDTDIKIKYAIDKKGGSINSDIKMVSPEDELERVDAIVVTVVYYFDAIFKNLSSKTNIPIISLEEILHEVR